MVIGAAILVLHHHPSSSASSITTASRRTLLQTISSLPTTVTDADDTPFSDMIPERQLVVDAMELQMLFHDNLGNESILRKRLATNGFNLHYVDVVKPGATVMIVTSYMRYFKTPIVVFLGSGDDGDDIFTDALAELVDAGFENSPDGVKIHHGIYKAMFEGKVVNDIEERVLKLLGKEHGDVIVTGFSLGHSNGQIMGAYLADKYPGLNVKTIGFASPVVGNMAFKTWSESMKNFSCWRYVYKNDIVPRLHIVHKLDLVGWNYVHAGHLVNVDLDDSTKAYYHQSGDVNQQYAGVPQSWYSPTSAFTYSDHSPTVYDSRFSKAKLKEDEMWPSEFEKESIVSTE